MVGYLVYKNSNPRNQAKQNTQIQTGDWVTYINNKYSYEIKHPKDIVCGEGAGVGVDASNIEDVFYCSPVGLESGYNTLGINIQPQIINPSSKTLSFHAFLNDVNGKLVTTAVSNNDILGSISSKMASLGYKALSQNDFSELNGIGSFVGFSRVDSTMGINADHSTSPIVDYNESWFFMKENTLFSVYIGFVGQDSNGKVPYDKIARVKQIFSTFQFPINAQRAD